MIVVNYNSVYIIFCYHISLLLKFASLMDAVVVHKKSVLLFVWVGVEVKTTGYKNVGNAAYDTQG